MSARGDNAYRAWRRRRSPRRKFPPNEDAMHQYEEAIILRDCAKLQVPISAKALRRLEPGRYSLKLYVVLVRMGSTGRLKRVGAESWKGRIMPLYALPEHEQKKQAAA